MTYHSSFEEKLHTATGGINEENRDDQYAIEKLIQKMGDTAVFCNGKSTVLYRGFKRKCNRNDYADGLRLENGVPVIPTDFPNLFFGTISEHETISLPDLAKKIGFSLLIYKNLYLLQPSGIDFSADPDALDRFAQFFDDALLPDPTVNVSETRTVVSEAPYPADIVDWRESVYTTCYSPAIAVYHGNIYFSHEFSQVKNWKELDTVTVIKESRDDGKTWKEVSRVPHLRWAGLFVYMDCLYLSGTDGEVNGVRYVRFSDDVRSYESNAWDFGCGWTSPNNILITNDRIYQALGTSSVSASYGSDLLDPLSWTISTSLRPILTTEWFLATSHEPQAKRFTVMEGNLLSGKDGKIYNIMRTETQPTSGYAAILELSRDGKTYSEVSPCHSLLHFPTSVSKFVIRYDDVSQKYYSLTSMQTIPGFGDQRNILTLVESDDLFQWKRTQILLSDREMMNSVCSAYAHSFQYVDFVIDGNDILMAVREASGKTNIWHDGNFMTFYRLKNFRELSKG